MNAHKLIYRNSHIIKDINGIVPRKEYHLMQVRDLPRGSKTYDTDGEPVIFHPNRKILVEI